MCFFTFALWWNIHAFYSQAWLLFFLSIWHLHRSITIATRVCLMRLRENHKSFHGFNMQQITGNLPFEFNSTSFIIYPFCFSFKTNWLLKYPYFKISFSTKKQHTFSEIHSIRAFTNHMNARPKIFTWLLTFQHNDAWIFADVFDSFRKTVAQPVIHWKVKSMLNTTVHFMALIKSFWRVCECICIEFVCFVFSDDRNAWSIESLPKAYVAGLCAFFKLYPWLPNIFMHKVIASSFGRFGIARDICAPNAISENI